MLFLKFGQSLVEIRFFLKFEFEKINQCGKSFQVFLNILYYTI